MFLCILFFSLAKIIFKYKNTQINFTFNNDCRLGVIKLYLFVNIQQYAHAMQFELHHFNERFFFLLHVSSSSFFWHNVMGKRSVNPVCLSVPTQCWHLVFLRGVKFMLNLTEEWKKSSELIESS